MSNFIIPSSTGKWYDYRGDEVTDFSSDEPTTLYADPSMDADGSKLVNLRDLKAALESHGGSSLPLAFGDVLYQGTEDDPGCVTATKHNGTVGISLSSISNDPSNRNVSTHLVDGIGIGFYKIVDETLSLIMIGIENGYPGIFIDGTLLDPAIDPYGFAYYATDQDFEDYVLAGD